MAGPRNTQVLPQEIWVNPRHSDVKLEICWCCWPSLAPLVIGAPDDINWYRAGGCWRLEVHSALRHLQDACRRCGDILLGLLVDSLGCANALGDARLHRVVVTMCSPRVLVSGLGNTSLASVCRTPHRASPGHLPSFPSSSTWIQCCQPAWLLHAVYQCPVARRWRHHRQWCQLLVGGWGRWAFPQALVEVEAPWMMKKYWMMWPWGRLRRGCCRMQVELHWSRYPWSFWRWTWHCGKLHWIRGEMFPGHQRDLLWWDRVVVGRPPWRRPMISSLPQCRSRPSWV